MPISRSKKPLFIFHGFQKKILFHNFLVIMASLKNDKSSKENTIYIRILQWIELIDSIPEKFIIKKTMKL